MIPINKILKEIIYKNLIIETRTDIHKQANNMLRNKAMDKIWIKVNANVNENIKREVFSNIYNKLLHYNEIY
jgi:hypothetical protein